MKIIVGLGNPGKEYENTRHNAGFRFVDELATRPELAPAGKILRFRTEKKFEAEIVETAKDGEKILLVRPLTFMNLSGQAVSMILSYFKVSPEDLIVAADDKDLPIGQARIRNEGGSAGQKGLQNIIDTLKTDQFTRIRLGITKYDGDATEFDPPEGILDTAEFVLSPFSDREVPILSKVIEETIKYVLPYLGNKNDKIPDHTLDLLNK